MNQLLNATDAQQVLVSTVAALLPAVSAQSGLAATSISLVRWQFVGKSSSDAIQWAPMTAANGSQFFGGQGATGLASDPLNLTAPASSLRLVLFASSSTAPAGCC